LNGKGFEIDLSLPFHISNSWTFKNKKNVKCDIK
jgi:hypothetical protein